MNFFARRNRVRARQQHASGPPTAGFAADRRDPTVDDTAQHLDGCQGARGPRGNGVRRIPPTSLHEIAEVIG